MQWAAIIGCWEDETIMTDIAMRLQDEFGNYRETTTWIWRSHFRIRSAAWSTW